MYNELKLSHDSLEIEIPRRTPTKSTQKMEPP